MGEAKTLNDVFEEGRSAYKAGKGVMDNPYPKKPSRAFWWEGLKYQQSLITDQHQKMQRLPDEV